MPARARALRAGPTSASSSRVVPLGRQSASVAVLVEAWGAGGDRDAIQAATARLICEGIERTPGSTTARIRAGLLAAHRHVHDVRASRADLVALGVGASVLVVLDDGVILAQAGPALAFRQDLAGISQVPESSPWLGGGVTALSDDAVWPPLGLGSELAIHWSRWPPIPGTSVLLVPSTAAVLLSSGVAERLLAAGPSAMRAALVGTLGNRTPAVHVALTPLDPDAPEPDHPAPLSGGSAHDGGTHPLDPDAPKPVHPAPLSGGSAHDGGTQPLDPDAPPPLRRRIEAAGPRSARRRDIETAARLAAVRLTRHAARVLRAILPERTEEGAYRRERTRLLAAACVVVPLLEVGLALAVRGVGGAPDGAWQGAAVAGSTGGTATTAETDAAADPAATHPGDDPGTVRLAPTAALALPGDADDERHLVAVGAQPYVLNVARARVDVVAGDGLRAVLARGQVVGGDTVADLVDLLWLPNQTGTDGRVAALDAAGRLWSVSGEAVSRVALSDEPKWFSVSRAAGFSGNMYVLDRTTGQILRYLGDAGTFPSLTKPGAPWLSEPASLANAADLAIDGSIYVLDADGTLRRFVQGQLDGTAVFDKRSRSGDTRAIYTSPSAGRLLIADRAGGRILVLQPTGSYSGQLLPPSAPPDDGGHVSDGRFVALQDVWWDEAGGTLYVVDGSRLLWAPYR